MVVFAMEVILLMRMPFKISETPEITLYVWYCSLGFTRSSNCLKEVSEYLQNSCHPVWGPMENYTVGREKRRQLLLMLCQHEADRLEVWAQPVNTK